MCLYQALYKLNTRTLGNRRDHQINIRIFIPTYLASALSMDIRGFTWRVITALAAILGLFYLKY